MLIDFEFANFRSFRDTARLSLEPIPAFKERPENTFSASKLSLLKGAALYGPNAGGKSNFIKAVGFATNFVAQSAIARSPGAAILVTPFRLDTATESAPSRFQFTLLEGELRYRYGFSVDHKEVQAEWLYVTDFSKQRARQKALFLREGSSIDVRSGIPDAPALISRTRADALFLSVAAQWNDPLASQLVALLSNVRVLYGLHDDLYQHYSANMAQGEDRRRAERMLTACRSVDPGLANIRVEEQEVDPSLVERLRSQLGSSAQAAEALRVLKQRVRLEHPKYSDGHVVGTVAFDLEEDASAGTQKYFRILGPIIDTLEHGLTLFVDELEAKLHPLMTRSIVQMFQSSDSNPKNAQLVFCTHDTNLLTYAGLRRDQIWFVEKSKEGSSTLYPLSDFNGVRQESDLESDYISGRFGAIPFPGGPAALADLHKGC